MMVSVRQVNLVADGPTKVVGFFKVEKQAAAITESIAEMLPILTGLNGRLAVRTLDNVAPLAAINVGLYGLRHAELAEQGQHWRYVLPKNV